MRRTISRTAALTTVLAAAALTGVGTANAATVYERTYSGPYAALYCQIDADAVNTLRIQARQGGNYICITDPNWAALLYVTN